MIRFISALKKRRLERDLTTATECESASGTQQAPVGAKRLQQHHRFLARVKAISKRVLLKGSKVLNGNDLRAINTTSRAHIDGENLELVQSGGESGRTFFGFEDLPIELRLAILELYLEQPRITTLNFQSDAILQYHCICGRRFRLTCGSLPPILRINHEYRETFLERFTIPGVPRSLTTLSLQDALHQAYNQEPTVLYDSLIEPSSSVFPVFATHTRRNLLYDPKDTVWIQGDFWLDETRRSTLARSVFYGLQHLAIPYKTRKQTLFELEDMWDFVGCIISTFPDLKTITMVLDVGEVIAERPIYTGEINFSSPASVKMVVDVPDEAPPTSRQTLSRIWRQALGKTAPSPAVQTENEHWTAERLAYDAWRILNHIKERAIVIGYDFPVNSWETPREVADWVVPAVRVVTAHLSTASNGRREQEPTIKLQEW
ncbi:hypothetical protein SBOR_8627 [Sclerotinia borealis F-4128]|uniref:2EXR domain-containing protein n=1 Tax=Sclerotinia borealis (strain F-4128) TaxID=1432307 RepID=W9C5I7_SCLBF|nr:hypothetical protein SBOR_8627 [Sclerotinia borealis F-4128]